MFPLSLTLILLGIACAAFVNAFLGAILVIAGIVIIFS